jgi:hypothetical protein
MVTIITKVNKVETEPFSSFKALYAAYRWKPIYGCPGRYILKEGKQYTLKELTRGRTDIQYFSTTIVPDLVCVVPLKSGGIISYKKRMVRSSTH